MKTILLTNHYSEEPYRIINNCVNGNFNLKMLESNSQECLVNTVSEADYILASGRLKIGKQVLDKANKLKMIQRTGVGLDSLDLKEISLRNIPLYVNQGINAQSVAEHTLLLILACLRKLTLINANTKAGIWEKQSQGIQTLELSGKTIGIIGLGNVAKILVKLLKPFGVTIHYYDKNRLDGNLEKELGIDFLEINDILAESDILTLHCPLTEDTKYIINANSLKIIKDKSILINTARGGLVETSALIDSLKTNKLSFAALDVYEQEPPSVSELMRLNNVILTPHVAGITFDSFKRMMQEAINNISLFDRKEFSIIEKFKYKINI